jgi:hypothetical protein
MKLGFKTGGIAFNLHNLKILSVIQVLFFNSLFEFLKVILSC